MMQGEILQTDCLDGKNAGAKSLMEEANSYQSRCSLYMNANHA